MIPRLTTRGGRPRKRLLGVAAAAALLAGTSCASGASPPGGGATGPTTVKVLAAPIAFEALYIGRNEGFFKEHGLQVEISSGGSAASQIPQLLNGQVQFAMSGGLEVATAVSKDIPVAVSLGNQDSGKPITSGIVARAEGDIQGVEDLQGKTVGVAGLESTPQLATMMAAKDAGVDPDSITFVDTPLASMLDALRKGEIDAAYPLGPYFAAADSAKDIDLIQAATAEHLSGAPAVVFAASQRYAQQNPGVVKRFNAAMQEAFAFANSHEEAQRAVDLQQTQLPEDYVRSRKLPELGGVVNRDAFRTMVDAMAEFGFIETAPSMDDLLLQQTPTG